MWAEYVVLGLGSNISPRKTHILKALDHLNELMTLVETSSLVETKPQDVPTAHDNYYNLVAVFRHCLLSPHELLRKTRYYEQKLGRFSKGDYAPRSIDIDILFYNQEVVKTPALSIPHPSWHKRPFVYRLLAECTHNSFLTPWSDRKLESLMKQPHKPFVKLIEKKNSISREVIEKR